MQNKKAFITGITGQDGSYLAELLLSKNYEVFGLLRHHHQQNYGNVARLSHQIKFLDGDLANSDCLNAYIKQYQFDEIYNLAAFSHVGESWNQSVATTDQTGLGALRIFEAVRNFSPQSKVYQASSSELFGEAIAPIQNEKTPIHPKNPYAAAKALAHFDAQIYRQSFNLFISTGILFNHESPRRSPDYVTRKISLAVAAIKLGLTGSRVPLAERGLPVIDENNKLQLGNLDSKRDWGYAADYVEAMWQIMQLDKPDDFVVATGITHSIKELCQEAFSCVGLNWQDYVTINPQWTRPSETGPLVGDASKIHQATGWTPKTTLKKLVKIMVDSDIILLQQ